MRLICPNCSAEYEVDVSVIPPNGRDVQCSNCAHAWFEPHPDQARATAEAVGEAVRPTRPQRVNPDVTVRREGPTPDAPARRSRVAAQRAARNGASPEAPPEPAPVPRRPRREVDPSALKIVQEEAIREARIRRGETPDPIDTQQELALDGRAPQQPKRMAPEIRNVPDEDLVAPGAIAPGRGRRVSGSRKEMLPDIEEINSSLRASTDRKASVPAYNAMEQQLQKARRGQGFRLGFSLMLIVAAVGMFSYLFAPEISARYPQTEPFLERYTTDVNTARGWLDTTVRDLSAQITQLIADNG